METASGASSEVASTSVEPTNASTSAAASFTCTVPEPKPVEKPFVFELPDPEDQA